MADEFVYIRLGDHGDDVMPGRVTRKAYDDIWSGKGYAIVDTAEAELMGSPATVAELRGATSQPATAPDTEAAPATASTKKRG